MFLCMSGLVPSNRRRNKSILMTKILSLKHISLSLISTSFRKHRKMMFVRIVRRLKRFSPQLSSLLIITRWPQLWFCPVCFWPTTDYFYKWELEKEKVELSQHLHSSTWRPHWKISTSSTSMIVSRSATRSNAKTSGRSKSIMIKKMQNVSIMSLESKIFQKTRNALSSLTSQTK